MKSWPTKKLEEVLTEYKKPIAIEDDKEYKQLSVKLHNGGCVVRETQKGALIKTKRQFLVKKNTIIYGTQNLARGAIGIVPEDGDGAVITQNMRVFDYDKTKASLQYLSYIFSSPQFNDHFRKLEYGSARAYIYPETFLNYKILLPSLPEQKRIVAKIEGVEKKINELKSRHQFSFSAISQLINSALNKIFEKKSSWYSDKINNLVGSIMTGTTPPSQQREYFDGNISWFTPSDIGKSMYLDNSTRKISQEAINQGKAKYFQKEPCFL